MNLRRSLPTFVTVLLAAGAAMPLFAGTYVSGLLHEPIGGAQLGVAATRRLPVHNLGSSGNDGVEVRLHSVYGGGVGFELTPMLGGSSTAREIRIRPKGWDGTIKSNMRTMSSTAGVITQECDMSAAGAASLNWRALDSSGNELGRGTIAAAMATWGINITPDPGRIGQCRVVWSRTNAADLFLRRNEVLRAEYAECTCDITGLTSTPLFGVGTVEFTGEPCAGLPENCPPTWTSIESVQVTASGLSDFVALDAGIETFDADCSGLGQSTIAETDDSTGTLRRLAVDNLGSSGQDGVSVDLRPIGAQGNENTSLDAYLTINLSTTVVDNPSSGSTTTTDLSVRCPRCSPGHVTLLKRRDTTDPASGSRQIQLDCSGLGSPGCEVYFADSNGVPVGHASLSNTDVITVPSSGTTSSEARVNQPRWLEIDLRSPAGSGNLTTVTLPGGASISGVAFARYVAVNASSNALGFDQVVITSNAASFSIDDLSAGRAVYVSGLPHTALGGAQLGTASGRRLPVHNLGSSGQDGVEVKLFSAFGGGAGVEIAPLLATTGTLRTAFKGWDGTIKGRIDLASHGNGSATCTADFPGATGVQYKLLNASGLVVSEGTFPPTGVDFVNYLPCPDGNYPTWQPVVHQTDFGQTYVTMELGCWGDIGLGGGSDARRLVLTPGLPPGTPFIGIDAMQITANGVTDLAVVDATLQTFGVACSGLGAALLDELSACSDPVSCTPQQRKLEVSNIGSSGQDGVSIDLGPGASGGQLASSKRCPDCPPGHTTLLKLYDDQARQTFGATQSENPATGQVDLLVDSTGLGASTTLATFYGPSSNVLATEVLDPASIIQYSACSTNAIDLWEWNLTTFVFHGCGASTDYLLPSGGVVSGVASVAFQPVSPATPRASTAASITSNDPEGFLIDNVVVNQFMPGDMNCNGVVDSADAPLLVQALLNPSSFTGCRLLNGDLNGDLRVDGADIQGFVTALIHP